MTQRSFLASVAETVFAFPARRPRSALICAAIFLLLTSLGLWRIHLNTSLQTMFPEGKPSADAMIRVLNRFPASNELVVLASTDDASTSPDRLLQFATQFEKHLLATSAGKSLTSGVIYRADPEYRRFAEQVVVPAGLYYLDDAGYADARERMTPEGMRRQIDKNLARLSQPGAAGSAAKIFLQDPLGLHELVRDRLMGQQQFKTWQGGPEFISPDGRAILVRVVGTRPPSDLDYCEQLVKLATAAAEQANAEMNGAKLKLNYTGAYAAADFSHHAIKKDSIESIFASILLLQVLFLVVYRRPFRQFLLELSPVVIGVFAGFGLYGWLRGGVSPVAAVIGGILAGMGIDYSVLYLAAYFRHLAVGRTPAEAVRLTGVQTVGPMFAAWVTSAIGFVTIAWSSVPTLRDFGLLGTLGLVGVFLAVAFVLPAVVLLWDTRRLAKHDSPQARQLPFRWDVRPMLSGIHRYRRAFIVGSLILFAISAITALTRPGGPLPLEADVHVMHPQPNPVLAAEPEIARRFGTEPGALLVHLKADSAEKLVELSYEVDRRLSRPEVRAAGVAGKLGLASVLPDPSVARNRKPFSDSETKTAVKEFKKAMDEAGFEPPAYEKYAEFLQLVLTLRIGEGGAGTEAGPTSPPSIGTLDAYPNLSRSLLPDRSQEALANERRGLIEHEAITLIFIDQPTDRRETRDALVNVTRGALADLKGATLTGLPVISYDTEQTTRHDLPVLLSLAGVLVLIVLLVYYRSISRTALALLPLVFSLTVLAAVARLTETRLNLVNLVALPLLIGIDVDYGIYFVSMAGERKKKIKGRGPDVVEELAPKVAATDAPDASGKADGLHVISYESKRIDPVPVDAPRDQPNSHLTPLTSRIAASTQAVITCAAASMLGFGSLVTVSVPAIRSLGLVVAIGVIASVIGTFALRAPVLMEQEASHEKE